MRRSAIAALTMLSAISAASAAGEQNKLSCTGTMIEPTSLAPSPKNVRLTLSPANKVTINLGQGDSNARVLSDNKIQVKFQTKEFVGEFFHYTGDLLSRWAWPPGPCESHQTTAPAAFARLWQCVRL
jgi:hypothetical protein